ncbi:MAG: glycosyltransferase family 2 protein [Ferruginibacter sp.]
MDLSIIIINYNVKYFLEQCLLSVLKACDNIEAEIIVVDNNSTDGSKAFFSGKFPSVKFCWNPGNKGFAAANNQGMKMAEGEYILLLNPDTIIPEKSLERCLSFAKKQKDFGALGVHMIDGSGYFLPESKRAFPGVKASFFKMTGMAGMFPRSSYFAEYYAAALPENQTGETDVLAGAFLMMHKNAIELTGGLDEDFFMYGEDIDFCYRIKKAGLKNFYFPEVSIVHFKGESSGQENKKYLSNFYQAMELFVKKHYNNRKAVSFFLMASVKAAAALARMRKSLVPVKKRNAGPLPLLVICAEDALPHLLQLLKHADPPVTICGRISPEPFSKILLNIDTFKTKHIEAILCPSREVPYETTIALMQQQPGFTWLFHGVGSASILGSPHKSRVGIVIREF